MLAADAPPLRDQIRYAQCARERPKGTALDGVPFDCSKSEYYGAENQEECGHGCTSLPPNDELREQCERQPNCQRKATAAQNKEDPYLFRSSGAQSAVSYFDVVASCAVFSFTLFRIPERQLDWAYYLKRPRFRHSSGSPPCLGPVTILFTRACPPLTAHRALDKVPPFDMAPSIPLSKSVPIAIPFTSASAVRNMNLPAPSLRSSSEETAK